MSVEYRHDGCAAHAGLYNEHGEHLLGRSVAIGGIEPTCSCATGTPPAAGPAWRQGSCGEAGPFIGLSFAYSIALVKRMNADPDGYHNAFSLKAEVCALPEPDVFRDFTIQEIIEGMAGSYSWPRAHTLAWIARGCPEGLAWDAETLPAPPDEE